MKRLLFILYFLELVPENSDSWGMLPAPLQFVSAFLLAHPLKLPFYDIAILLILFFSTDRARKRRAKPMQSVMWLGMATMFLAGVWGVLRGGSAYQIQFQLHMMILCYVMTFTFAKLLTTPADFWALGKVILYAAIYRSFTCIAYFVHKVLIRGEPPPATCTTHPDSVLFVTGFVILLVYAVFHRANLRKGSIVKLLGAAIVILLAIQFNNRRLAWVSLVSSLVFLYAVMPTGPLKKRINKRLLQVGPILALYVGVGTGRSEKIFAPVQALSSVKSDKDTSTRSRDLENAGLITTLAVNPLMGVGLGNEYIEIDASLSAGVSGFVQYRYLPHNSVLGLLAFTGALGFAAIWMMFPVGVFVNAYCYRRADSPIVRTVALVGMTEVVPVINQWYGDLGATFELPGLIMASGFAAAIRLPSYVERPKAPLGGQSLGLRVGT